MPKPWPLKYIVSYVLYNLMNNTNNPPSLYAKAPHLLIFPTNIYILSQIYSNFTWASYIFFRPITMYSSNSKSNSKMQLYTREAKIPKCGSLWGNISRQIAWLILTHIWKYEYILLQYWNNIMKYITRSTTKHILQYLIFTQHNTQHNYNISFDTTHYLILYHTNTPPVL